MFIPFLSSPYLAGTAFMEFYRGIDNSGFLDLCSAVISVVAYILTSRALYTLAKDREIPKPWLAWVPIGCNWILGYLSDQYQGRVHKKMRTMRIVLVLLQVVLMAIIALFSDIPFDHRSGVPQYVSERSAVICLVAMLVVLIIDTVITCIVLYDVYRSCDPDHATLYLVLSMFIVLAQAICLFICREKHDGMKPPAPRDYQTPWQPPQPPSSSDPFQIP